MSKSISISRNIFFNVSGYVVSVVVAFLIAPITIRTLGDVRYGAWTLVAELIGYYGLLDLGIRGAVTYRVARYAARDQTREIRETLSTAFWVLAACGALAFLVGVALALGFPYLFRTEGLDLVEVKRSLLIMSGLIALSLPMNAFAGGLVGRQRFDVVTGVEAAIRVLTAVMTYIVLKNGGGLVALSLVHAAGRGAGWAFTLVACRSILGGVFVLPKWFRMERVRELSAYGFRNAVGQIALQVIYRMDLTVVGMFVGVGRVTCYSIAAMLVSYATMLCSSLTFVFTPRFTELESRNAGEELRELYLFGMRVSGMVVAGLVAGMLVFGRDFIRLWLGKSYVNGPWTDRSDLIMAVLLLANLPRMLQSISWQRLFAMARVRFLMWLNLCEAAANLILSILLAPRFGPMGVAMGTFFPLLASSLLVMPIYSSRVFDIPLGQLLRKGWAIPLITGLLMVVVDVACIRIVPPDSWRLFFFDVLVAGTLGAMLCIGFGFSREERRELAARFRKRPAAQAASIVMR